MQKEEIELFANKRALINERTVLLFHDKREVTGYFFNNSASDLKENNQWHFVIIEKDNKKMEDIIIHGKDVNAIKIIQLF